MPLFFSYFSTVFICKYIRCKCANPKRNWNTPVSWPLIVAFGTVSCQVSLVSSQFWCIWHEPALGLKWTMIQKQQSTALIFFSSYAFIFCKLQVPDVRCVIAEATHVKVQNTRSKSSLISPISTHFICKKQYFEIRLAIEPAWLGSAQLELAHYGNELARLGSAHYQTELKVRLGSARLAARASSFGLWASSKKNNQLAEPKRRASHRLTKCMHEYDSDTTI